MKSEMEIREMIRRNENQLKITTSESGKTVLNSHIETLKWVILDNKEFGEFLRGKNAL